MNLSLLATTFAEFMKNEWLGLVASALVLVSFLMTNQIKTRLINMVGCIAFVVYGLLLPSYSTAIMNFGVFVVHIVFITKHFVKLRKEKNAPEEVSSATENISQDTSEKEETTGDAPDKQ